LCAVDGKVLVPAPELELELEPRSDLFFAVAGSNFLSKPEPELELEPRYFRIAPAPNLLQIKLILCSLRFLARIYYRLF